MWKAKRGLLLNVAALAIGAGSPPPTGAEGLFPVVGEDGLAALFADATPDLAINWAASPGDEYNGDPFGAGAMTFTRASAGTYHNASGVLASALSGVPRYDHDRLTPFAPRGLMIEMQRTNLVLRSQELDHAAWPNTFMSKTTDAAVAPDGTTTAEKLVEDANFNIHYTYQGFGSLLATTRRTVSLYEKVSDRAHCSIGIFDSGFDDGFGSNADLTDKNIPATRNLGTGTHSASSVEDVGNTNWVRHHSSGVAASSGTNTQHMGIGIGDSDAYTFPANIFDQYQGLTGPGVFVWGAQAETADFASSYIPTTTAQVTRSADTVSIAAASGFPLSATLGSLIVRGRTAPGNGTQVLAQLDDGSENERFRIVRDSSGNIRFIVTDGGVEQANIDLGVVANNTNFQVAVAWAAGDFAACLNGGTVGTDAAGTLPTVTTLRIGCSFTGEQSGGHSAEVVYVPRRMTNGDLQVFTS